MPSSDNALDESGGHVAGSSSSNEVAAGGSQHPPAMLVKSTLFSQRQEDDQQENAQQIAIQAFPTDAKARQNEARKLAKALALENGEEAPKQTKRKFAIEDHHDDCGENLDS